ncbi:MAG: MFS transporter [Clostridiales bacterium]|jgi:OPA family glycerol-3-phosphate transporter-like MFS transporter|nr:MFS transporter [Clostridiales bacterium]
MDNTVEAGEKGRPERGQGFLIFVCFFAYAAGYIGRLDYSAAMPAILSEFQWSKTDMGIIASAFFFCYGAGQFVNGILVGRYNVRLTVSGALLVSAALNGAFPFCRSIAAMAVVWGLNGAAQSVLWCTIMRGLSERVHAKKPRETAITVMSVTVPVGTLAAYGLAALFSRLNAWRVPFFVSAGVLIGAAALYFIGARGAPARIACAAEKVSAAGEAPAGKGSAARKKAAVPFGTAALLIGVLFICAAADGFLKDGLTSWTPILLFETYALDPSLSILLTLALPLCAVGGAYLARYLMYWMKNHFAACGAALGAIGLLFLPLVLGAGSLWLTVALLSAVACLRAAIGNILTSRMPFDIRHTVNAGRTAGVLDAFAYVGSIAAGVGIGAIATASGWGAVLLVLCVVAAAAGTVTALGAPMWRRRILSRSARPSVVGGEPSAPENDAADGAPHS